MGRRMVMVPDDTPGAKRFCDMTESEKQEVLASLEAMFTESSPRSEDALDRQPDS